MRRITLTLGLLLALDCSAANAQLRTQTIASGLGANKQEYTVSRDGRFLLNQPAEASITSPITLILNWKPKP